MDRRGQRIAAAWARRQKTQGRLGDRNVKAAEVGSRLSLPKRHSRWRIHGFAGLMDRSSAPEGRPRRTALANETRGTSRRGFGSVRRLAVFVDQIPRSARCTPDCTRDLQGVCTTGMRIRGQRFAFQLIIKTPTDDVEHRAFR